MPKAGLEKEYQSELSALRTREQKLGEDLARTVGKPFRANPWVTLDELRDKLGARTAFVDIARFSAWDFAAKKSTIRYVAWITPPAGKAEVQLIDLGPAKVIDDLVAQTRAALLSSAQAVRQVGEVEALESLQKPLRDLSAKALHPLLSVLKDYDDWIVCPDGALWLTPWNALTLPDDKFVVEKYQVRHVVSGRDLVLELPKGEAEAGFLFADPDYDLSPQTTASAQAPTQDASRSTSAAMFALPRVARLPGTALEAEAVHPRIQEWLKSEPKLFMQAEASEALVRSVKNPRVLILATHGYFLAADDFEAKKAPVPAGAQAKRSAPLVSKVQAIENPLLRCGLLLAGCNRAAEAKSGDDDGVLTGLEIVGMNLNGCELVVLSACETGLGDVRNGEGVAGLRQAIQLAGAKSVLASLWQVPDRDTALLMNTFYGEIATGRSQTAALREAQLRRISSRRTQFGAAHPFYWAAFTLTSRGTD